MAFWLISIVCIVGMKHIYSRKLPMYQVHLTQI